MKKDDGLDPRLASLLEDLKSVPTRDPRAASHARSRFLAQAVSAQEKARHNLWNIFSQKEQFAMKLIVTTLVIVGLLFGGNATVAAAQSALPTNALYQIKLASEEVRLAFTTDPIDKIDMLMEQAQARTQEMVTQAAQGTVPNEALIARAQNRIQLALRLTADLNDDAVMIATLAHIQTQLQDQERQMDRIQDEACTECEPILQRTRDMLHTQLHEVENGLADPQSFRNTYRHQDQTRTTKTPSVTGTPISTDTTTAIPTTPQGSCTPALDGTGEQNRNGNGNPTPGTPVPQDSGNGSGGGNGNGGVPQSTPGGQQNGKP